MAVARADEQQTLFDRFAELSAEAVSHAVFFIACVVLVVLWVPSYFLISDLNTWQLIINTVTTIITFLLVALLQNSQRRQEVAMNEKLDALADGLADLLKNVAADEEVRRDVRELRNAIGAERVG